MSKNINTETHLFIIWKNAYDKREFIIDDIKNKLDIIGLHEIQWSDEKFEENLVRFYRKRPNMLDKMNGVGKGLFSLIVVEDKNPNYDYRDTSKGRKLVNYNIFDLKMKYRSMTGENDRIHSTINIEETEHDLTLLLGLNTKDYKEQSVINNWKNNFQLMKKDIVGSNGWDNISQLFYVLNSTIPYVVMRNFEPLPENYFFKSHGDIDILVNNLKDAAWILKAEPIFPEPHRVHMNVKINNEKIPFDIRYSGDNYYDKKWQNNILSHRVFNKGFYIPDEENHFYTLFYHGFIHKGRIKPEYIEKLIEIDNKFEEDSTSYDRMSLILRSFLIENGYEVTRPEPSVFFNEENANRIINVR